MKIPQYLIIAIYSLSLGVSLVKHGKEEIHKYNFFATVIATVIVMAILKWGGFFQ